MELEKANNRRVSFPLGSEARRKQPVKPGSPKIRREKGTAAFNNNFSLTGNLWEGSQTGGLTTDFFDTERVRVTIRVRPPTPSEAEHDFEPGIDIDPEKGIVRVQREDNSEFQFDAVLPPTASQADVYAVAASPIVTDVLNGYNGTIMAYGQTGAGKTYTLSCTQKDQLGIMPRAAGEVFSIAKADTEYVYRVSMSYLQIYMEMLQDLLKPSNSNMQIRESENGVYVSGIEEVEVRSQEDCLKLLHLGEKNRTVAFTRMNALSSRSHAIAIITVEKKRKDEESSGVMAVGEVASLTLSEDEKKAFPTLKEKILVGKLFLVDLAGSERLKKSGSEGLRAVEAKSVNLSLTSLGKCISALADPLSSHIPFRDSKLTRLLQESLGGNAKTSLVINVAPSAEHIFESFSSLQFGMRAMKVNTQAQINEEEEYRQLTRTLPDSVEDDKVHSLEVEVYSQDEQLAQAKAKLHMQEAHLQQLQSEMDEIVNTHKRELTEQDLMWEARLQQAEEKALQSLAEAQESYHINLERNLASFNAQRENLNMALKHSQTRICELEGHVKSLEEELQQRQLAHMSESARLRQEMFEEALHKAKTEWAAILIQRYYRARKRRKDEGMDPNFLKQQFKDLAISAGHQMVSESISRATSALSCLSYRFMKLEDK